MSDTTIKQCEIMWKQVITVNDIPAYKDKGKDARGISPGLFGSQYGRMLKLADGRWLIVYTIYDNDGYSYNEYGGNKLEISISEDNCRTWRSISSICDYGRDLDNGQMIQLPAGDILLACRSVRWQESYRLPVYRSRDCGMTWELLSFIDRNEGKPGELGNPDKGVYEPHMLLMDDGRVSVLYASEKHVVETPSYSQIIVQKISMDNGLTWGNEIFVAWDAENPKARPGMSVCSKMRNGEFIVVFEVIATEGGDVFYKVSEDGITWSSGIGKRIPGQKGGAYIVSLESGRILVTSNSHNVSISDDFGETWYVNKVSPWETLWGKVQENGNICVVENGNLWPSIYETDEDEIIFLTSVGRAEGGNNIQIKIGRITEI